MTQILNKYIIHLKEDMEYYNITCEVCYEPSMISGSYASGSVIVEGIMCSYLPCPEYFIPIST